MRQITISGNLGSDPEVRTTQNGSTVANFSVAVRQTRPDENGQYGADWFRCSVWGNRASTIQTYYHKGSHVVVSGSLEFSEYNGSTQFNVFVNDFDLPDNNASQTQSGAGSNNYQGNVSTGKADPFANNGSSIEVDDNDLPF
ncbi:single-stranded DNA-binding protein [Lentilactobacillus sp. SPB1-3]|uniref:Single-stranded DNA-binding protein n=1 Tax=Lentilactobacillus terminaliae TaxID=3003483 RepID=A0ACD5DDN1_9LACO|nr:single-stranded DNA-binding protein [Lentilactobacillus sp. SPB1-3]MCZ0978008.1 single-stranded DNA-binding protein [Lentilactobacillus sp. SPB1-3]